MDHDMKLWIKMNADIGWQCHALACSKMPKVSHCANFQNLTPKPCSKTLLEKSEKVRGKWPFIAKSQCLDSDTGWLIRPGQVWLRLSRSDQDFSETVRSDWVKHSSPRPDQVSLSLTRSVLNRPISENGLGLHRLGQVLFTMFKINNPLSKWTEAWNDCLVLRV